MRRRCRGFETVASWSRATTRMPMLVRITAQVLEEGICHSLAKPEDDDMGYLQLSDFQTFQLGLRSSCLLDFPSHKHPYYSCFVVSSRPLAES